MLDFRRTGHILKSYVVHILNCLCIIYVCNTFTPQIKVKFQCIYLILHWVWNVNEIYALLYQNTGKEKIHWKTFAVESKTAKK